MAVVVIIGLLVGLVTINVRSAQTQAKQTATKATIATICDALEFYYGRYDRYPSNDQGLAILTKADKGSEPFLTRLPTDPWGRPFQYNQPGRTMPYEVISFGADGREGGEGVNADISSENLKAGPAGGAAPGDSRG